MDMPEHKKMPEVAYSYDFDGTLRKYAATPVAKDKHNVEEEQTLGSRHSEDERTLLDSCLKQNRKGQTDSCFITETKEDSFLVLLNGHLLPTE